MVKAVVANTKAAALGGGRGSDWEEREKKLTLLPWPREQRAPTLQGRDPPGERERGEQGRFVWWLSVWFEEEGDEKFEKIRVLFELISLTY